MDRKAQTGYLVLSGAFDRSEVRVLVLIALFVFLSLHMLSPSISGVIVRCPSCRLGDDAVAMGRSFRSEFVVEHARVFEKWSHFERGGVVSLLSVNMKLVNDYLLGTVAHRPVSRGCSPFFPFSRKSIYWINIQSTACVQKSYIQNGKKKKGL